MAVWLDGDRERAVDLDCDAALEQVDGQDQEALVRLDPQQNALDIDHRPADDPHALALLEIRVGPRRYSRAHDLADHLDFVRWHDGPAVPRAAENADEAAGSAHFHVAVFVEHVVEEQIAGEHRDPDLVAKPPAAGPDFDRRQERMKSPGLQLVAHELLAVAAGPENEPSGVRARGLRAAAVRTPPVSPRRRGRGTGRSPPCR